MRRNGERSRRQMLLLAVSTAAACREGAGGTPVSGADRFIDKLYVEVSPEQALPFTRGAARSAVEEMVRLRGNASVGSGAQPRVYWERVGPERAIGNNERQLEYRLRIEAPGAQLYKRVTVSVQREGDAWMVSRFTERDEPAPGQP
jgi:hypothetical protein